MTKYYTDDEMDELETIFGAHEFKKEKRIDWWLVAEAFLMTFTLGLVAINFML